MESTVPGMKKYYIGLAVLFVSSLTLVFFVVSQAGNAKQDKKTTEKFDAIANKLDEYSYSNNSVPGSLSDIGVKDVPATITYQKINEETYKICTTYSAESNVFDAGWFALLGGAFASSQPTESSESEDTPKDFLDRTQSYYHKKGKTCQTVKPFGVNSQDKASGSTASASCNGDGSSYAVYGYLTVDKVDTNTKTISFNPNDQIFYDKSAEVTLEVASIKYDDNTVFCYGGNTSSIASVKPGQSVVIYLNSSSDTVLSRIDGYNISSYWSLLFFLPADTIEL